MNDYQRKLYEDVRATRSAIEKAIDYAIMCETCVLTSDEITALGDMSSRLFTVEMSLMSGNEVTL